MSCDLCLTITFLDPRFHGRREGGEPEWPPSPLRLFQAIVAAAAAPTGRVEGNVADSLRWFERLPPPRIVTPGHRTGEPYRLSVPNNAMDLVVKAWAKGNYDGSGDANPATHRTMKTVRPTHMLGGDQVRYTWTLADPISEEDRRHADAIRSAVRGVVSLGWGVDLVVGHGHLGSSDLGELQEASTERWAPGAGAHGVQLRVPRSGTLDALIRRHSAFRDRVTIDGFVPVPPLTAFNVAGYRRTDQLPSRPFAAFLLRPVDALTGDRKASIPQHRVVCIAAMLRHAACEAAKGDLDPDGWRTAEWGRRVVAGHGADESSKRRAEDDDSPRLSYLPLPSFEPRGRDKAVVVGDIRRVVVAELSGQDSSSVDWAGMRLSGAMLVDEQTRRPVAVLEPLSPGDFVLRRYIGQAGGCREWSTVTPVILPGYDDNKLAKRERLMHACLDHAGLLAAVESIESRPVSWFPGAVSNIHFKRSEHLRHLPAVHARLIFREPVQGPISLGAGRHCGLGILAAET